jgi:hypothetical protein
LKSKRDFELASISALLFFHQAADRIDDDEVRALRQHLSKEDGEACVHRKREASSVKIL